MKDIIDSEKLLLVASNLEDKKFQVRRLRIPFLVLGFAISIYLFISIKNGFELSHLLVLGLCAFAALALSLLKRNRPFIALTDEKHLIIRFVRKQNRTFKNSFQTEAPTEIIIPLNELDGYKKYSFMKESAVLEIMLNKKEEGMLHVQVPLDDLQMEEKEKLIRFLEHHLPHRTTELSKQIEN